MISPLSNIVSESLASPRRVASTAQSVATVPAVQPTTAAGNSRPESFVPLRVDQVTQSGSGAPAEVQRSAQPLVQQAYGRQQNSQDKNNLVSEGSETSPGSPFVSAVDLEGEFTTMIRAQAAYGANVQVQRTSQEMIGEALDITT